MIDKLSHCKLILPVLFAFFFCVFVRFCTFLYVFVRFCTFLYVFVRFCTFLVVCGRLWSFVVVCGRFVVILWLFFVVVFVHYFLWHIFYYFYEFRQCDRLVYLHSARSVVAAGAVGAGGHVAAVDVAAGDRLPAAPLHAPHLQVADAPDEPRNAAGRPGGGGAARGQAAEEEGGEAGRGERVGGGEGGGGGGRGGGRDAECDATLTRDTRRRQTAADARRN